MERLTFEGNFCDIAQCRELPCPYNGACSQRKVWERLKAYEDRGCAPEEVLPKDKADEIALNERCVVTVATAKRLIRHALTAATAADVAPVVRTRWAHLGGDEWCCPVCGFVITTEGSWDKPTKKYCEDCGAKMDGGGSDAVG